MAKTPGGPPERIFYGYWVVLALSVIVFLSVGIRFTIGPFLEPVAALLPIAAGLSITINEAARPAGCALTLPGRPDPMAGGR